MQLGPCRRTGQNGADLEAVVVGKFLLGMVSGGLVVTGGLVVGSMLFPTQPANDNAPVAAVEAPIAAPEATAPDAGEKVSASADPEPTATEGAPATAELEPEPEVAPEAMSDAGAPLVSDDAPAAPQDDTASASAAPEIPAATDVAQPETSVEPSKPAADASDPAPATATLEATPSEPAADAVSAPDELQIADAGTVIDAPAAPDAAPKAAASDAAPAPAAADPAPPAPAAEAVVAPGDAPEAAPAEPAPAEAAPSTEVADAGTDQQPVATGTASVTDPAAEAAVTQAPAAETALAEAAPEVDAPTPDVTAPEATAPEASTPVAEDADAATEPATTDTATVEPDGAVTDPAAITPEAAPEMAMEAAPEAMPEAAPEAMAEAPAAEPVPAEEAPSDPMAVPATDAGTAPGTAVTEMPGTKPSALPGVVAPEADTSVAVAEEDSDAKTFKPSPGLVRAGEGVIIGRNQPGETAPTDPATDPAAAPTDPRPIAQFAAQFENPDAKPPFAIVLVDPGTPDLDRAGLAALPFPVSFALDPQDPATPERAAIYRAAGREVVMLVTGIAQGAQASDVEVAFQSMEQGLPEAVAAMDLADPIFQNNRGLASAIVPILQASGRGLLTWDEGLNAADQVARREDLEAAVVFRNLDQANGDTVAIRRLLDRAVFKADQDRRVSVVGTADAATVAALLEWSVEGKAATVALAPLTAVLQVD